jgi:hypothetical protein
MWIYLNSSFLSIVENSEDPSMLHVRARREGDIEEVFPDSNVTETPDGDYKYRTDLSRDDVAEAIARNINGINYTNFKNSIDDEVRHDVYMDLWSASHGLEESVDEEEFARLGELFKGLDDKL